MSKFKTIIISIVFFLFFFFVTAFVITQTMSAQVCIPGGCAAEGMIGAVGCSPACGAGSECCQDPTTSTPIDTNCIDPVTGNADPNATYVSVLNRCVHTDEFLSFMLNLLIIAGVLASVYRMGIGFFLFITAQGDPTKLQAGREALTEAIVGLVIIVSAWTLVTFFESFAPAGWWISLTGGT